MSGNEPAENSKENVGVVPTGAAGRVPEGLEMLANGEIDKLHLSGLDTTKHPVDKILEKYGYPPEMAEKISTDNAATTPENGIMTAEWAKENGYKNITLITSETHVERAKHDLEQAAVKEGIKINVQTHAVEEPDRGWFNNLKIAASEELKNVANWINDQPEAAATVLNVATNSPLGDIAALIVPAIVDDPSVEEVMDHAQYQNIHNNDSSEYYNHQTSATSVASSVQLESDNGEFCANAPQNLCGQFNDAVNNQTPQPKPEVQPEIQPEVGPVAPAQEKPPEIQVGLPVPGMT